MRARDNGPQARVIVTVRQMDWHTGAVRVIAEFDSDSWPTSPDAQGVFEAWGPALRDERGPVLHLEPVRQVYWAEAHLIKNGPEGNPGIAALGVMIDQ